MTKTGSSEGSVTEIRLLTTNAVVAVAIMLVLSGVVFPTSIAQAQTLTVLHTFSGSLDDGAEPAAGLIADAAGNLYGTTSIGGRLNSGTLFKLDPSGNETVLYSFGDPGVYTLGGVIRDANGNLYGTNVAGGAYDYGTVFKWDPTTGLDTVLYSFTGGADGGTPRAGLIRDSTGTFYGTTLNGGTSRAGTVFKLNSTGETVLYSFTNGLDGGYPEGGVVRDADGNLYGTTVIGGASGDGTVFKVTPTGAETVLYSFTGGVDGINPEAGLIRDSAGSLYGTTAQGGIGCLNYGCGTVFKLDLTGRLTVLHNFTGSAHQEGANPEAGLIEDRAGNLYGTTTDGGIWECGGRGCGTVFRLDPTGKLKEYSFTGGTDGASPLAGLIRDAAGNLYGTTSSGGASGCGTVFRLSP